MSKYLKSVLKIPKSNIYPDIDYVDFVYETEGTIHLVELKPYTSQCSYRINLCNAIGQILRYETEYREKYKPQKDIELQIVMKGYNDAQIENNFDDLKLIIQKIGIKVLIDQF